MYLGKQFLAPCRTGRERCSGCKGNPKGGRVGGSRLLPRSTGHLKLLLRIALLFAFFGCVSLAFPLGLFVAACGLEMLADYLHTVISVVLVDIQHIFLGQIENVFLGNLNICRRSLEHDDVAALVPGHVDADLELLLQCHDLSPLSANQAAMHPPVHLYALLKGLCCRGLRDQLFDHVLGSFTRRTIADDADVHLHVFFGIAGFFHRKVDAAARLISDLVNRGPRSANDPWDRRAIYRHLKTEVARLPLLLLRLQLLDPLFDVLLCLLYFLLRPGQHNLRALGLCTWEFQVDVVVVLQLPNALSTGANQASMELGRDIHAKCDGDQFQNILLARLDMLLAAANAHQPVILLLITPTRHLDLHTVLFLQSTDIGPPLSNDCAYHRPLNFHFFGDLGRLLVDDGEKEFTACIYGLFRPFEGDAVLGHGTLGQGDSDVRTPRAQVSKCLPVAAQQVALVFGRHGHSNGHYLAIFFDEFKKGQLGFCSV
eukprot:comp24051_c0_seq1/m.43174 comp24051_c0_seq1/g.43174  ORF comp24051_c0_seq1/g.43174 comp24051_c0_seq1/m.43174 type:complete len:485 (+) comp24051_c0_seq1:401-1855(+)